MIKQLKKFDINVHRRFRARPFSWEWHNYNGVRFFNVSIGHPRKHCWWATSITIYVP